MSSKIQRDQPPERAVISESGKIKEIAKYINKHEGRVYAVVNADFSLTTTQNPKLASSLDKVNNFFLHAIKQNPEAAEELQKHLTDIAGHYKTKNVRLIQDAIKPVTEHLSKLNPAVTKILNLLNKVFQSDVEKDIQSELKGEAKRLDTKKSQLLFNLVDKQKTYRKGSEDYEIYGKLISSLANNQITIKNAENIEKLISHFGYIRKVSYREEFRTYRTIDSDVSKFLKQDITDKTLGYIFHDLVSKQIKFSSDAPEWEFYNSETTDFRNGYYGDVTPLEE